MNKPNNDKQTKIIYGNTEIIIREIDSESSDVEKSLFKKTRKKVAIRIESDIYDFIIKYYGERGFTEFYNKATIQYIESLRRINKNENV